MSLAAVWSTLQPQSIAIHTPCEIGAADIGTVAVTGWRRTLNAASDSSAIFTGRATPHAWLPAALVREVRACSLAFPSRESIPTVFDSNPGKLGAYLSLKLKLPASRSAPLAVGSAPVPFRSWRAKSSLPLSVAIHAAGLTIAAAAADAGKVAHSRATALQTFSAY